MGKYRCLVFDHDDTTVNSTATIHYPCFMAFAEKYHLDLEFSLEDYVRYNFEPGLFRFYREICGMSDATAELEYRFWTDYTKTHRAVAFPGIREIMEAHRAAGGILAVVSYSWASNILLDYAYNGLPEPDAVFGFEQPREELKPSPLPLKKIMEQYSLQPEEMLVIDDLKPGLMMARAAGVSFAAAAWCFDIPANTEYMKANADYFCRTPAELAEILA